MSDTEKYVAVVDKDKCKGCGACISVCPTDSIKLVDNKAVIDPLTCIGCGACTMVCPNQAIECKMIAISDIKDK